MTKSKKPSSKTSKTSVNELPSRAEWRDNPSFATVAIESRAQTVAWALSEMQRAEFGSNVDRANGIVSTLDEFTYLLYSSLSVETDKDFLFLASAAITFFVVHMMEAHDLPSEHVSGAINLLTFYSARFYHNMEPKT